MNEDQIKKGDHIDIYFNNAPMIHDVVVVSIGNTISCKDLSDGRLYNIKDYAYLKLRR